MGMVAMATVLAALVYAGASATLLFADVASPALVLLGGLLVPFEPAEAVVRALQRDEAEAVGEDLVLDDGGVVVDEDVFDGEGGDLGEQDAAEGVCDGCVEAGEGEGGVVRGVGVEGDVEVLGELVC